VDVENPSTPFSTVTVAVVCLCSARHLSRCFSALRVQRGAPPFDVLVAHDPRIVGVAEVVEAFPGARAVALEGQRTPLELASLAARESRGDVLLLTEDHCVPDPDWVRILAEAPREDRAAVGGRVEVRPGGSATDWAFYFVDFYRYAAPVPAGPSPSLTVCNVAYLRAELERIREVWNATFHETAVHEALRARFGELWLEPAAVVEMARHVRLRDALRERYAFGRLFGCTRLGFVGAGRRLYYTVFAPALPVLLMARMAAKAARSPTMLAAYARSFAPLLLMVVAWSWGEWLGYLTRRLPRSMVVAPELE